MTNFEYYKDEITKTYRTCVFGIEESFYIAFAKVYARAKGLTHFDGDYEIIIDWLAEEHKETIKLTQFEYDSLSVCYETETCLVNKVVKAYWPIIHMMIMGYFRGIKDKGMKVADILKNCEVVER